MVMAYPTKVQLIQRKDCQQWYVNFPAAIAQGTDFEKGEDGVDGFAALENFHAPRFA
jgi:hypothetical protein